MGANESLTPARVTGGTEAELSDTRAPRAQATHLPAYYYTSPEILELEKERLFFKDWLVVGRVEEWPNPGDYRAMEIVGEPVAVEDLVDQFFVARPEQHHVVAQLRMLPL